jgi:hypothetical protein
MAGMASAALLCTMSGRAAPVDDLQRVLVQWVELRQEIAAEKRAWREKERWFQREIDLLRVEKAELDEVLRRFQSQALTNQGARTELIARKERMTAALEGLKPALDRAEADLREFQRLLPPALADRLAGAFRRLPASARAAGAFSVAQRLQVVMALFSELESLQHGIHVAREVLPVSPPSPPGGEGRGEGQKATKRELDVLYLGLARGFAVTPDDTWAAAGMPAEGGWRWHPAPAIAPEVRRALRAYNRETVGEVARLPVVLEKEAQP